jgi:integrase
MGPGEIRAYLSHLATDGGVTASTQNVALAALLFLYRDVLQIDLPAIEGIERARRPAKLPVVFTRTEVNMLLRQLSGNQHLMASLLYGAGLRLMECLRLRVKDIDFEYHQLMVRAGKGGGDRVSILPRALEPALQRHLAMTNRANS